MQNVAKLERAIGHRFRRKKLIETALTHPSHTGRESYERLEFLGDIVLDTLVGIRLFKRHPKQPESFLTNLKSAYVNRKFLQAVGEKILLHRHILSRTPEVPRLDDFVEAIIGALFLDGGWKTAERFVRKFFLSKRMAPLMDYKSELFTFARRRYQSAVQFRVAKQTGPPHRRTFHVKVRIPGRKKVGNGQGSSIKEAEMQAARNLLEKHAVITSRGKSSG